MTEPIPGPPGLPFVGNILDVVFEETSLRALEHLAEVYGPIYQIRLGGKRRTICSSAELLAELTDEKRFVKMVPVALSGGPGVKGLFAAENEDPDWGHAHRILTPAFGPLAIEEMFDGTGSPDKAKQTHALTVAEMKDIANQLILKWARQGTARISATQDFTRLTLDTIALCSMDYRFNSFYQESMHPFVDAMINVLAHNGSRSVRPAFVNKMMYQANAKYIEDGKLMKRISQEILDRRRAHPREKNDLLNAMLNGVDPKTGEKLRDELIIAQMTTFLIAGHETTSGLLSFAVLNLLKNSHTYLKAQKEVDDIVGKDSVQIHHLKDLKYLHAVLRETLRLFPTAPAMTKKVNPAVAHEPAILGGRYTVEPNEPIIVLLCKAQQDYAVYGEDAAEFKPERMLDEEFNKLPKGAWSPFGNGVRACIGRAFAWQEALMVMAMILQNFDVQLDDPAYQLRIKQALTIKPKDLFIRVNLREGSPIDLDQKIHRNSPAADPKQQPKQATTTLNSTRVTRENMFVAYGSNTGTCQALAQRLASDAITDGFEPKVKDMDAMVDNIPKQCLIIFITSSYEGQAPDNAARFVEWLQASEEELDGVRFAVFGCGHSDWSTTFHRIPKLVDQLMGRRRAQRIVPAGFANIARGNVFGDFEDWLDGSLWPELVSTADGTMASPIEIEISTQARASSLRHDIGVGVVKEAKKLTLAGEPAKCHLEVQLPLETSTYECGDYLAVLPLNPDKLVRRVMAHFHLPWDAVITLKTTGPSVIPSNVPLSVYDVLRSYVELSQPATKKTLRQCIQFATGAHDKDYLEKICEDSDLFEAEVLQKRRSLFDVLTERESIFLPFGDFLASLPPMGVRQYSISSSPLDKPGHCTITFGVISAPSLANPNTSFEGVGSTYLSSLSVGDSVQVSSRPTAKKLFRLPADDTPLLMFCAGTGLAPFRGFVQHRAIQLKANPKRKLSRAVLFIGCRWSTKDRLYADELDEWTKIGAVEVKYAFSKESEKSDGCAYVSDRMVRCKDDVIEMWRAGARIYVCGSRGFAESLRPAARRIFEEAKSSEGTPATENRKEMFERNMQERIVSDIFD